MTEFKYLTSPFRWTGALVSVLEIGTGGAIDAGFEGAVVKGAIRWLTHVTLFADTLDAKLRISDAFAENRTGD